MTHLKIPIIQAPIGGASSPELCIAVSEAGGCGSLALSWRTPEVSADLVRIVRAATASDFLVNFALAFPPVSLVSALDAGAPIVSFSWGDPSEHVPLLRSFGARFGVQVVSVEGARFALDLGADFLICQGMEAGGHVQSASPLVEILEDVVKESGEVPVYAAGGISTHQHVKAMISRGATGCVVGTRFLASQESWAHHQYKQLLVDKTQTALTNCFCEGWENAPHRVLKNSTFRQWEAMGSATRGFRPDENAIGRSFSGVDIERYSDAMPLRTTTGDIEAMCLYAGAGVKDVQKIEWASEILRDLWSGSVEG